MRRPRRSPRSCSPRGTKLVRTEPLKALVIGALVRGLSMRDVESLCEQAGLGKLSKTTASRICEELKERYEAFKRRDLYEVRLAALFLDATYLAVRPDGPKEGVLVAWGFTRSRRARAAGGDARHARVLRGLARARTRSDRPRPRRAAVGGRRRRPRADQSDRAVLARLGPPTLLRAPRAQPLRQAARARTRTHPPGLLASARRRHRRTRRQAATPGAGRRARSCRLHRRRQLPGRRPRRARRPPAPPHQTPPPVAQHQPAGEVAGQGQLQDQGDRPLPSRSRRPSRLRARIHASSNVAARSQHRRGPDPLDDGVASVGVLGDGFEHAAALPGHDAEAAGSELASQHVAAPRCRDALIRPVRP